MSYTREQRRALLVAARHNQTKALSAGLMACMRILGRGFFGRMTWLLTGR